jgi:hypothetical protein
VLLWLVALPLVDITDEHVGEWFGERRALAGIAASGLTAALIYATALLLPRVIDIAPLNPVTLLLALALGAAAGVGQWRGSVRAGLLAGAAVLCVLVLGLSVTGALRGPDWQLWQN